jgi:hypothetical protein
LRITLCLLAVAVISLIDPWNVLLPSSFWRYLPALVVPVTYAAVGPLRGRTHAVLWIACALTAVMEADVLLYAAGGMAAVAAGELLFDRPRRWWLNVFLDAAPVAAGLGAAALLWAATGTFTENLRWFGGISSVSAFYGTFPDGSPLAGLTAAPSMVTLLATLPALLLVVAVALRGADRVASMIVLAAAGATALLVAKHLVRPQGQLVLYVPLVGLAWAIVLSWSARAALAAGAAAGLLLAVVQVGGDVTPLRFALNTVEVPVTAVRDARLDVDAARAARFAAPRYAQMPEAQAIVAPAAPFLQGRSFATLGDVQVAYPILGQVPPFHVALFNASQRAQQQHMVDVLDRTRPQRLLYRRDLNIDNVVYPVRNPIVFAWAIQHYVPAQLGPAGTPWDVLKPRAPGQPIDAGYWASRLGTAVDLGGIPSYSRGASLPPGRVPYALVSGSGAERVTLQAGRYTVTFISRPGVRRYAIRLDRLWFWPLVRGASLVSQTAGYSVRTAGRASDDLY